MTSVLTITLPVNAMNPPPVPHNSSLTGILVLDKPPGISSAGLLNRLKRFLPRGTKLGHAGTLDPFATGVLLALVGKATKRCESLMGSPKEYLTTVKLGATTPTLDPESPEDVSSTAGGPLPIPTREQVEAALATFSGSIQQIPPAFSAMKVAGRRAYDLARKGHIVALAPRPVTVYRLSLLRYEYPFVDLSMEVGRGFYVRSLARDLGQALHTTAYLTALRRTRVGPYDAKNAVSVAGLTPETLRTFLNP